MIRGHDWAKGDRVRLKKRSKTKVWPFHYNSATIRNFYTDIEGGIVLDSELDGFRCWNVQDLVRTRKSVCTCTPVRRIHATFCRDNPVNQMPQPKGE